MSLSQKSLNFARKILKHNPKPDDKKIPGCHQNHKHENCSHISKQEIKPYLHVHDHRKEREIYEKPTKQKLQNMRVFKEQGNEHFKNQKYQQAAHYYNKVIIFGDYTFPQNGNQQRQMDELIQQANCNLGIILIKLKDLKNSQERFMQAIKGPSKKLMIKGYYWLTKSHISQGVFQKARQSLQKLRSVEQSSPTQQKQLQQQLKAAEQAYNKRSKNVFSNIFSSQQAPVHQQSPLQQ